MNRRHRLLPGRSAMGTALHSGGGAAVIAYTVSGVVYDADGVTAVADATVAIGALSTTSGVDGTYSIASIPAAGTLTCTKVGYSWTSISITGSATGQNFVNAFWAGGGAAAICDVAYAPYGAADIAASYVNLVTPGTNNAAPGTAPTFGATFGWYGDGTKWLDTGYVPPDNASYVAQFTHLGAVTGYHLGASNATPAYFGALLRKATGVGEKQHSHYNNGVSTIELAGVNTPYLSAGVAALIPSLGYWNGVAEAAGTLSHVAMTVSFKIFRMGALTNTGAGKCQHLAIYDSALSEAQVQMITKGMRRFLPLVIYDGDSITFGTTATQVQSYPQVIMDSRPESWDWNNLAIGGSQWTNLSSANVISRYNALKSKNICVIWCGTNDLRAGITAANTFTRATAYCSAVKAAGFKVLALTALPRTDAGNPGDYEAQRLAYNDLWRNGYAAIADQLLDVAADARLDDSTDATYFSDLVHLTPAGYQVVADLVSPSLDSL